MSFGVAAVLGSEPEGRGFESHVALPSLELVSSSLRPGAIVACDNTTESREEYRDYFEFVHDPVNRFRTMTVPFQGGFELTVRV